MTTPILAWHGDPALKAEALAAMIKHRKQDDFIQGMYLNEQMKMVGNSWTVDEEQPFRGCFHGCLTTEKFAANQGMTVAEFIEARSNHEDDTDIGWHEEGEKLWGIPVQLGGLLDCIFESLPSEDSADFAVNTIEAMPVGADLLAATQAWKRTVASDPEFGNPNIIQDRLPDRSAVAIANSLVHQYTEKIRSQDGRGSYGNHETWYTWAAGKLIEHLAAAPIPAKEVINAQS